VQDDKVKTNNNNPINRNFFILKACVRFKITI